MGQHSALTKTGIGDTPEEATYYDSPQKTVAQANKNLQAANYGDPNVQFIKTPSTISGGGNSTAGASLSPETDSPVNFKQPRFVNMPEVSAPDVSGGNLMPKFLGNPQAAALDPIQHPSFQETQNDPALARKADTKGGKLLNFFLGVAQGGAAGAGQPTFGAGFQSAQRSDFQRQDQAAQQKQRGFENQRQSSADERAQAEADRQAQAFPLEQKARQAQIDLATAKDKSPEQVQMERSNTADSLHLTGDARTSFIAEGKLPTDFGKKDKPDSIDQQEVDALVKGGMTPLAALEKVNKDKRTHISISNGAAGSFGNLQNTGALGEDALKGAKPEVATLVRGIAKYEIDPASLSNRNNQRANVLALVKQFDPSYDQRNFGTSKNVMKEFTTGEAAKSLNAFNTATEHLKLLSNLADSLDNHDIPAFNAVANKYQTSTGNAAPTNFNTAKDAVVGEVAKTFAGQATVSEIAAINQTINDAQSPSQLRGAIQTMTDLMASKKKALQEQYEQGLKNKPAFESQPTVDNAPPPGAKVRDYSHIGASK